MTKYMLQETEMVIYSILDDAKKQNKDIIFDIVDDYEGESFVTSDILDAIEYMDGVDANFGINFMLNGDAIGWIYINPFEDQYNWLIDMTDNDFTNGLMKGL